jgi:hypothetical protein
MPFSPNFSTSQVLGLPNQIVFTDTSTGSDSNIASRRVYMQTAANIYLVELGTTTNYEVWSILDTTVTYDVLSKDYALYVTVEWLNASNIVLYNKQFLLGYTLYNESFDYHLTQVLSGNPLLINDNNFFENKSQLRVSIDSGNQALTFAADIFAGQQCYDRATNLRLNSPYFFNSNA